MKFKKLATLALSAMVVVAMGSTSVFAAANNENPKMDGTVVGLTKVLQVAEGIDVSGLPEFQFTATAGAAEDANKTEYVNPQTTSYPTISFANVKFANSDRNGEKMVRETVVDTASKTWPRAGLFSYTITETQSGETNVSGGKLTSNVNGDQYIVRVYVKNTDSNNGTAVDYVTIENKDKDKVDGTPDEGTETTINDEGDKNTVINGDGNGFVFTNKFVKDIDTNPDDPDNPENPDDPTNKSGAFKLTKAVLGNGDKTADFTFTVKIDYPSTSELTDTTETVTLKHNGVKSYATLPAGTKVTVSEAAAANYKASYKGTQSKATDGSEEAVGADPVDPGQGEFTAEGLAETTFLVGESGATVTVSNWFADQNVTPTGIVINNLPYVLLIVIALGGIVLFSRKRRAE